MFSPTPKMRVLGIDPGYGRLGAAIIERKNGREKLLFSVCLSTKTNSPFPQRLTILARSFIQWCKKYHPGLVAIEQLFFASNRKTALRVAEVKGLLLYLAAERRLPTLELTPAEIKSIVTGYGRADKKQVAAVVQNLLKIKSLGRKILDDEFDAIAIALAGLAKQQMLSTAR